MNVVVVLEYRFLQLADGTTWTATTFARQFWRRYLDAFEGVRIVARAARVTELPPGAQRVDGERMSFVPVPHYVGPLEYARHWRAVRSAVHNAVGDGDAVILRVPSQLASTLSARLRRGGRPYGIEVVGDPYDTFAPGAMEHPLRPVFRYWFSRHLRRQCGDACAAAYVTEGALQRRYPCNGRETHYSSIELRDDGFACAPRIVVPNRPLTAISVGTLAQLYKAPDVLLQAVASCVRQGLDFRLVVVGDGQHRQELERFAHALGIADRTRFAGQLAAGAAVRAELDQADLFVLPSRQEGLPRAMIEAMARGLPCIGSTAGGIPELLPHDDLVPPGDVAALAAKLREVAGNPERMLAMSARNLERARDYHEDVLRERRRAFYQHVERVTRAWQAARGPEHATAWATGRA